MRFSRKQFFDSYRKAFGALNQTQVVGLEFLLGEIEKDAAWKRVEEIAYVLATVQHETAHTFQPIKEYRAKAGTKARRVQDAYWGTGFYGRGFVQLTHEFNYRHYGIASDPDKALEPAKAYEILSDGMRQGVFTKRKLSDFINDSEVDYTEARTIVNGHDKAQQIADNAEKFERILKSSLVTNSVTEPSKPDLPKVDQPEVKTQEPEPPAAQQAPKPTVTPVEAPPTSITTKVAATAGAIGPVIAATGLKIGGVEFKTGGLIAFAAVVIVGMVVAAWIWNQSQERRERRQRLSMENLASDNKGNVIAAGSKV